MTEEELDEADRRELRDADAMLNAGKDVAAVLQALEISEATLARWRAQQAVAQVPFALVRRALHCRDGDRHAEDLTQEGRWLSGSDDGSGSWRPSSWPRICRTLPAIGSPRHPTACWPSMASTEPALPLISIVALA